MSVTTNDIQARTSDPFGRDDPLAEAMRCAHLPMVITDALAPDNPIVFANDAFLKLCGYDRDEVLGRNCRFMQGPDTDPGTLREVRARIDQGQDVSVEILNYRKDGSTFWNALHVSPVRIAGEEVRHFFGSQSDVSDKKAVELQLRDAKLGLERSVHARTYQLEQALEQKTVLLHEVDHRVKNNLQLISALMLLQARRADEASVRRALERMLERLNAISTVHRRLFQSDDAASFDVAEFLRDLAADLSGSTGREDIVVNLELEPVTVPANQAASLALMVNEVVSNALRHAFPEERAGRLTIQLTQRENGFCIRVDDDGIGRSDRPKGFGSTIIDLLGRQLKADIRYRDSAPGLGVHIDLPLSV